MDLLLQGRDSGLGLRLRRRHVAGLARGLSLANQLPRLAGRLGAGERARSLDVLTTRGLDILLATRGLYVLTTRSLDILLATRGLYVLTTRGLDILLATRGLHVLTARGLDILLATRGLHVLTTRSLDILLATRGLHVLTARGLHVLTTRSLDVLLATRGLHVLTARSLDVLSGTGQRARRLDLPGARRLGLLALGDLADHRLGLGDLRRARRLGVGHGRHCPKERHAHERCENLLHQVTPVFW
ncbi:MAG: hypothetical protein A2W08_12930 [Candidatus Rokubacteria bacterium RBG_16_73_20]|nr:MAG: hypothetical protein A2050_00885 [Candidatus Rokubacteria bacterium GWA2_73_35]OGK95983.1 MAG: hypothetical protein A2W08_12930 [Candidatus Rokubacteria bacterium RBG_16_73_20]